LIFLVKHTPGFQQPSRYEAPPRNVACEVLPQNNALQNV